MNYNINFDNAFQIGDIITNDPEFGNLYEVKEVIGNMHIIDPYSHEETATIDDFNKGREFIKVYSVVSDNLKSTPYESIQVKDVEKVKHIVT